MKSITATKTHQSNTSSSTNSFLKSQTTYQNHLLQTIANMPFTIAAFVTRLPTLSPTDFQAAYESHVSFLRTTVGAGAPESITRHYVRRAKADPEGLKVVSYTGSEETFGYDLVAFLNFKDEDHAKVFQQAYGEKQQEIGAKVAEFAELSKFRVIAFQDAIED
jgi:hypothetical protein